MAIYELRNPAKACKVDSIMARCMEQDKVLYMKVCRKYRVLPELAIQVVASADVDPELTDDQMRVVAARHGIRLLSLGV